MPADSTDTFSVGRYRGPMSSVRNATPAIVRSLGYVPALDGLRAIAILAVLAQHAGFSGVRGYHGVTLFFVISGYLITRLLLQERARTGRVDLRRFFKRRLARLGPALVLVVLVTAVWLLAIAEPFSRWWAGLVGSLTYTTDLVQAVSGNGAVGTYFQWSWSLGVEELFYLVWPAALLLMVRWRRSWWAAAALVAAVAGCWILRAALLAGGASHDRFFFAPDTNADALLLGTLVALLVVRLPHSRLLRVAGRCIGPIGLVYLVAMTWPHGIEMLALVDAGGLGQAALASAALVFWVSTSPTGWGARVLAWRPLASLGKLSYGLYLWNILTISVFATLAMQKPAASWWGLAWLGALIVISWLTWRYVETPLRKRWSPVSDGRTGSGSHSYEDSHAGPAPGQVVLTVPTF
jgi:peptidoglycan/LPS O-acetylase OafA/YrhL